MQMKKRSVTDATILKDSMILSVFCHLLEKLKNSITVEFFDINLFLQ